MTPCARWVQLLTSYQVITNEGNSYDPRHGEFTAPYNATYEFTVAMLMGPGYWSGIEVVKNGNRIAEIRSGDSGHWSMSATVVTAKVVAFLVTVIFDASLC